jgi:gas vesicle protein
LIKRIGIVGGGISGLVTAIFLAIKKGKNSHKASRDFFIQKNKRLISIFGGKWTTAPSIARKIVIIINNE